MSERPSDRPAGRAGGGVGGVLLGVLAAVALVAAAIPVTAPEVRYAVQLEPARPPARSSGEPTAAAPAGASRQLVSVVAPSAASTTGRLTRWVRTASGRPWRRVGPVVVVRLGAGGLTRHPREGEPSTPLGSYSLTQAFGRDVDAANRLTRLPYHRLRPGDGWNTAPGPGYNRLGHTGELYAGRNGWAQAAVLIDYNVAHPRAGAGSGFFVHVASGGATRGCVGLPRPAMFELLRWLDPSAYPRIVIAIRARG